MKKVISVNLNNQVFQMEEDAYNYLNTVLNAQWKKQELEVQIAERLEEKCRTKTVVTYADVANVLHNLGYAEPPRYNPYPSSRRLYRQPENKMIAGVCTGLGEYFDVDPVAIRVLFVIAFFFGSLGFWIYMVLWLIVPKTPRLLK